MRLHLILNFVQVRVVNKKVTAERPVVSLIACSYNANIITGMIFFVFEI